jgi:hypothetical protein
MRGRFLVQGVRIVRLAAAIGASLLLTPLAWAAQTPLAYTAARAGATLGVIRAGSATTGAAPPAAATRPHLAIAATTPSSIDRMSRLKALGASWLLPGLGHRMIGREGRARFFTMVETGVLLGVAVSEAQGYVRKRGYVDYAESFAGVADAAGKPDWYYRNLGQYRSSDDYVDDIARTARALYGDDLAARDAYVEQNRPGPGETWRWDSNADRREFRERRKASRNAYRRASLFIGGALLNRLLSSLDAARLAGKPKLHAALEWLPGETGESRFGMVWTLD